MMPTMDHTRQTVRQRITSKKPLLGKSALMALCFLGFSDQVRAHECDELVKMHGLLGRAFIQCRYTFYSRGFVLQAEACGGKIGDKAYKQLLAEGKEAFDTRSIQMGQPALCSKILKDFPYTVRQ
jgi:hypothetical protein